MNRTLRTATWAFVAPAALAGYLAAAPPAVAGEIRETSERIFALKPGASVKVENANGRITVEAWDRPEARVQITRVIHGRSDREAKSLISDLRVDVTVKSSGIELTSRVPKRRGKAGLWDLLGRRVAAYQIHYYIQVPAGTALDLESSNGTIRTRGTGAEVTARSVNGGVDLSDTDGETVAHTTNGDVRLDAVSGSARAESTNGSVTADFGDVSKGDAIHCETTNGNVRLRLPASARATIEARATNGRVDVRLPIETSGFASSKVVHGTLNGGGADVTARSTNGNVSIRPLPSGRRS